MLPFGVINDNYVAFVIVHQVGLDVINMFISLNESIKNNYVVMVFLPALISIFSLLVKRLTRKCLRYDLISVKWNDEPKLDRPTTEATMHNWYLDT